MSESINIRMYGGVQVTYSGYQFRATVGEREIQDESERGLYTKIDRALHADKASIRQKVQTKAIFVQGEDEPVYGTFRGLHAKHGTILFKDTDNRAVEISQYASHYLFPAGTDMTTVTAAAKALAASRAETSRLAQAYVQALKNIGAERVKVGRVYQDNVLKSESEILARLTGQDPAAVLARLTGDAA
jgi:hypothetical protein